MTVSPSSCSTDSPAQGPQESEIFKSDKQLKETVFLRQASGSEESEVPSTTQSTLDDTSNPSLMGDCLNPVTMDSEGSQTEAVPPIVDTAPGSDASDALTVDVSDDEDEEDMETKQAKKHSFFLFRSSYLFVTLVIMLADGLQGTHLYVLYEGYGFSVASLYCLGFFTGALTAPITGPLIDKIGRKKAALLYCALEVWINMLEQFPFLSGLVVSRVVGGITTNLLSTVFEAWCDTEYRKRGFKEEQYETLMRDSVVISNLAAIASGYLAHVLAEKFGPVGPFEGAVTCTGAAFLVVFLLWTENYGSIGKVGQTKSAARELMDTMSTIRADSRILRICITQGLTMGSLHIFIFLWSPILKDFSDEVPGTSSWGLDSQGEPAYGLIFGAFMAAGVVGGLLSPYVRKFITFILSPLAKTTVPDVVAVEGEGEVRPMAVEFQGAFCYFICATLLLIPTLMPKSSENAFGYSLLAFIVYEVFVGIYSPCEGVIRSLYMPSDSRGSMMTIPRIIVNVAVALGVISTEFVSRQNALGVISTLMMISGALQLSLVSKREWASLFGRIEHVKRQSMAPVRSMSMSLIEMTNAPLTELKRFASSERVGNFGKSRSCFNDNACMQDAVHDGLLSAGIHDKEKSE